jgi:hypothetical protein
MKLYSFGQKNCPKHLEFYDKEIKDVVSHTNQNAFVSICKK